MSKFPKNAGTLLGFIAFNQSLVFMPTIGQNLYYFIFFILLTFFFFSLKNIKLNSWLFAFIGAAFFSVIFNTIASYIQAPFRLISFIIIITLIGPLIDSPTINTFKTQTFLISNQLLFWFGALTFFAYLLPLGIPQGRGGFSGFMTHSMMLAPFLGVSFILILYKLYDSSRILSTRKKLLLLVALVFIFLSLLLASSRSAIMATLGGVLFFFFKYYQKRLGKLFFFYVSILIIVIATYPLWEGFTTGIQEKMELNEQQNDLYASRRSLWNTRLTEFDSSPIIGIGFANTTGRVNEETGISEPGSSWLAALSQTGVIGFTLLAIVFLGILKILILDKQNPLISSTLGGLLILFVIHTMAEGYMLASGSYLFFYLWLLLGIINLYKTHKNIRIV
jgi:O-antigen ligase